MFYCRGKGKEKEIESEGEVDVSSVGIIFESIKYSNGEEKLETSLFCNLNIKWWLAENGFGLVKNHIRYSFWGWVELDSRMSRNFNSKSWYCLLLKHKNNNRVHQLHFYIVFGTICCCRRRREKYDNILNFQFGYNWKLPKQYGNLYNRVVVARTYRAKLDKLWVHTFSLALSSCLVPILLSSISIINRQYIYKAIHCVVRCLERGSKHVPASPCTIITSEWRCNRILS